MRGCSAHSSTSALPKTHISVQSPLHPGMTDGTVCVLSGKPSSALTFDKWLCQGYLCASITPLPRDFIRISPFLPSPWTAREAGQSAVRHRPVPCRYSRVSRHIPGTAGQERSQGWLQMVLCRQQGSFHTPANYCPPPGAFTARAGVPGAHTSPRESSPPATAVGQVSEGVPQHQTLTGAASQPEGDTSSHGLTHSHCPQELHSMGKTLPHQDISASGSTTTTEARFQSLCAEK